MDAAINRANDDFSQIAATRDASSEQRVLAVKVQRFKDRSKCKADADHEQQPSSREQAEYERRAREENDRATLQWLETSLTPP